MLLAHEITFEVLSAAIPAGIRRRAIRKMKNRHS